MRVAIDVSGALAGPSGIRVYILQLIQALSRVSPHDEFIGYAAYWTRFAQRAEALQALRAPNISFHLVRRPDRLVRWAEERWGWRWQERWLRRASVDLLHGPANLLPPLARLPGVVTLHHVGGPAEVDSAARRFYFDELTRRSMERATRIIAISEFSRQEAIRHLAIPPDKIETVWEGAGAEIFKRDADPEEAKRLVGAPYFLFVSAINKRKNLLRLVRAFDRLKRQDGIPHRLVMVGKKHESYAEIASEIDRLGLGREALFLEGVDDRRLAGLYRAAEALVYPSLLEGFGLPILEAMGCGTPVIAARSSCLPEIAGEAALFFEGTDEEALAENMRLVLRDAALRQELIHRGFERVRRFSWQTTAEKTLVIYHEARASKASAS